MEEEIDFTKLKYVLYARRSTDDSERQIRSIGDQIYDCRLIQSRLGLNVVNILEESQSAKKPHQRPIFDQMLKDLRKGVYDGILAWNPDRLARNMLEGGEIIDMVDQDIIKDLKFVTHHFTKDANGKMLLGMAFVLSKQYSDDLSQKVTRGVRRNFSEGKTPTPKHGYFKDENSQYKPDGKNFELIVKAWELRQEGKSLEEITKYINENGYGRKTKKGRIIKMTTQILTDLFKDPFYYGVLIQNKQSVDLRELDDFFQPAITEGIYNIVQQLSYRRIYPYKGKGTAFYPLKMMIICSFCGSNMYIAPSTSHDKNKRYLNARCGNKLCSRPKKSIRMIKVFESIYKFFANEFKFTEDDYNKYYDNILKTSGQKRQKLKIEIHSRQGILKRVQAELNERSLGIIKLTKDSEAWKINENKINELSGQKQEHEGKIKKLEEKVTKPEEDRLSLEDFLNLSRNAGKIIQSANAIVKDQICRLVFTNLTVDEEKVLSYQAKEPFATLLKQRELLSGRG